MISKAITHTLLAFLMIATFCPVAFATPKKKIDYLFYFFDMNEAAFAYHRHCLDGSKGINKKFLRTLEYVADELFAEAQKEDDPRMNPEYIKSKILERRYHIQYKLDRINMKDGCYSQGSKTARKHYQEFSKYKVFEVQKLIEEQTQETR